VDFRSAVPSRPGLFSFVSDQVTADNPRSLAAILEKVLSAGQLPLDGSCSANRIYQFFDRCAFSAPIC
jgi:hypothetical protein